MTSPPIRDALRREVGTLMRFGTVGMVSTALHMAIAFGLVSVVALAAQLANLIAFVCALLFSFAGHYRITFRSIRRWQSSMARFALIACSAFAMSAVLLRILEVNTMWPAQLQVVISASIIPVANYVAGRFWVFSSE